jgi:hypothetical protein
MRERDRDVLDTSCFVPSRRNPARHPGSAPASPKRRPPQRSEAGHFESSGWWPPELLLPSASPREADLAQPLSQLPDGSCPRGTDYPCKRSSGPRGPVGARYDTRMPVIGMPDCYSRGGRPKRSRSGGASLQRALTPPTGRATFKSRTGSTSPARAGAWRG